MSVYYHASRNLASFGRQARPGEHGDSGLTAYRRSEFATLDKIRQKHKTRLGRFITSPRRLAVLSLFRLKDFDNKVEVYEITDSIENDLKKNVNPFSEIKTDAKVVVINQKEYIVSLAQSTTNENITKNTYTISKGESIILTLEIKTVTDGNVTTNTITSWRD